MSLTAAEVVDLVVAKVGGKSSHSQTGWMVCCPAHADSNPSLSVTDAPNGKVLLHCHAGCSVESVLYAIDRTAADIMGPESEPERDRDWWTPHGTAIARYRYTDEDGNLLFEVVRAENKRFLQRRPDPTRRGGWDWHLGDVRRPLYKLPKVIEAIRDGLTIYVCEGEKDADAVNKLGKMGTTNPGGAGKWLPEHAQTLREADVIVVPDRDDVGYRHARAVVKSLQGVALAVHMAEPAEGKDLSDHLSAGHSLDDLVTLTSGPAKPELAPDIHAFLAVADEFDWLVEGLLERGDRFLLTGFEGLGKSMLMRQLAASMAAGLHPFRHQPTQPLRVLMIDCENGERFTRRKLRPLRDLVASLGHPIPENTFYVLMRPSGIDLTTDEDAAWLLERCLAHKPDVLLIGPLYQLHRANLNEELPARLVSAALNDVRTETGCALIVEAHSGHGDTSRERNVRPIGSSLWLRWPEFGYGIATTSESHKGTPVAFRPWRGPRDERDWPTTLHRGNPWPWDGQWDTPVPSGPHFKPASLRVVREPRYDQEELIGDREVKPW